MSNNPKIKLFEGNYAQKVLSYYLWGQENPPEATDVADEKWIRNEESITVEIDATDYMQQIGNNILLE
ncbi:MAG: hypothetical protein IJ187_06835 [Neisseriaceae bacterium]|nr:hypothetical protein [Neisseriaceae bacterium]